jgi:CMP-N,N'-diacetyllegionaminic acid synthase
MPEIENILGLIPARGGSKGMPGKNLAPLAGKPLIAYSIETALQAKSLSRIVVSTDDKLIAAAAREHGAETPFVRPAELADDTSPALAVIKHALEWLDREQNWQADAVVYMQPTSPLRSPEHIDAAVEILIEDIADSVVSVVEVPHQFNPVSVLKLEDGALTPYLGEGGPLRRQDKPLLYARNGPAVLVIKRRVIMDLDTLYGPRTLPLIMDLAESLDIDTPFDLELAEYLLSRQDKRRQDGH